VCYEIKRLEKNTTIFARKISILVAVCKSGLEETRKRLGWHDELLVGDRKGQRSIRLNKQWRAILWRVSAMVLYMLVYYKTHSTYIEAARCEKRFKNWCRQSKINLIEELNPEWRDLYEDICS
jgi:putative endonuclease